MALDQIACPAGHQKKTSVTASCGKTRMTGSSQPRNMVRRSIGKE
jgi:hypothetical protein